MPLTRPTASWWQYLVFYHVNENVKVVEIHRVLRGSWNLPQYLE